MLAAYGSKNATKYSFDFRVEEDSRHAECCSVVASWCISWALTSEQASFTLFGVPSNLIHPVSQRLVCSTRRRPNSCERVSVCPTRYDRTRLCGGSNEKTRRDQWYPSHVTVVFASRPGSGPTIVWCGVVVVVVPQRSCCVALERCHTRQRSSMVLSRVENNRIQRCGSRWKTTFPSRV